MISHLSVGVSDLERSASFYDAALGALGYVRTWTSEKAIGYGVKGGNDKLAIKEQAPDCPRLAAGPGLHVAFTAPTVESVGAFHTLALELGGSCNGAPGLRGEYGESYYAAFVIDPDGHRLEAVHQ